MTERMKIVEIQTLPTTTEDRRWCDERTFPGTSELGPSENFRKPNMLRKRLNRRTLERPAENQLDWLGFLSPVCKASQGISAPAFII